MKRTTIFLFFIFLILISSSIVSAYIPNCHFASGNIRIKSIDLEGQDAPRRIVDFRQGDYLVVDSLYIDNNSGCNFQKYIILDIYVTQDGKRVHNQPIIQYAIPRNITNSISMKIQPNSKCYNLTYVINDKLENIPGGYCLSLSPGESYQIEVALVSDNESINGNETIYYVANMDEYTSGKFAYFSVISRTDWDNLEINKHIDNLTTATTRMSYVTSIVALIMSLVGSIGLCISLKIHQDNLEVKKLSAKGKDLNSVLERKIELTKWFFWISIAIFILVFIVFSIGTNYLKTIGI